MWRCQAVHVDGGGGDRGFDGVKNSYFHSGRRTEGDEGGVTEPGVVGFGAVGGDRAGDVGPLDPKKGTVWSLAVAGRRDRACPVLGFAG